jgi:tRNA(Arg) A34 adenosine deaminase TadA
MKSQNIIDRRNFLSATAATIGGVITLRAVAVSPESETPLPEGILPSDPLARYWKKPVSHLIDVDLPSELSQESVRERHRIYALLLMALVVRFWNGNNDGPRGIYPFRGTQKLPDQGSNPSCLRYKGDMNEADDPQRISWDRYLGHNIACLAVDGRGEIMDFDFNHNAIFRSSAEHAESRIVRRLFSLTDLIDDWKTRQPIPGKSRAVALKDITIYTSLESCAQCSGVMSLAGVKQVLYLQNDPGAYRIGNIMYNLAGNEPPRPDGDGSSLAALPIPGSAIGLPYLEDLNRKYEHFRDLQVEARKKSDAGQAYFLSCKEKPDPIYTTSITSFLCTDSALEVFRKGADEFRSVELKHEEFPNQENVWTNRKCYEEACRFFEYADVEGFRGSPHKL